MIRCRFWVKDGKHYADAQLNRPSGPAEPGDLLATDACVRQWINDMQKRP
jgi:hypothetical protein